MLRKILPQFNNIVKHARSIWTARVSDTNVCLKDDSHTNTNEIQFPSVWLRDNCPCPKCFHGPSQSRTIPINHFNFDAVPSKTTVTDKDLEIKWNDNHSSTYSIPWLLDRQFSEETQEKWKTKNYKDKNIVWDSKEYPNIIKRFSYDKILNSDETLLSWIEALAVWGVAIVEHSGSESGNVVNIANRIAFVKKTQFGELFRVEAAENATNVGYLSGPLQLHTDVPYYEYKPGLNFLHCLKQGKEGGETHLSDGFAVAKEMKKNHTDMYRILTDTDVVWSDTFYEDGRHNRSLLLAPVFCEDSQGEIKRVNFSQAQRDSHFCIPLNKVKGWYDAVKVFSDLVYDPKFAVTFKMNEGDIVTFDNLRVLHGRFNYSGPRVYEGVFLDWDHVYGRIRMLRSTVNKA